MPVADFWSEVDSLPGRLRGYSILYSSASDLPPAMPKRRANVARTFAEFIRGHTTAFVAKHYFELHFIVHTCPHSLLPGWGSYSLLHGGGWGFLHNLPYLAPP